MPLLTLYHTSGCHLCEEAKALVLVSFAGRGMAAESLKLTDIAEDLELLGRYGRLIPVLQATDTGEALNWPFDAGDIRQLIERIV
jgi:hypothetical protein